MDSESAVNDKDIAVYPASMDLNDFAMPSDEGSTSTESENSVNDGSASDSSCDYEFLQTHSASEPLQSDVKIGDEMLIVSAMEMIDYETDSSDLNVVSLDEVPKSTTPSELDSSEDDKSNHVLDDWHLVSQNMEKYDVSDDDSIVILEREVARPCYALTKVDPQTDVNGQSVLMTTSLITANKHVQTSDEVDSDPTMELQPFEEALLVESSIPFPKSNIRPWIIDCLLAGALFASLVLLFYLGDYIYKGFSRPPPRPSVEEANDAVMEFMVHIVRDFNSRIEEMQRNMEYMAENRDENAVSYKPREINEFFKRDLASITLFFDRYREDGRRLLANNKALYQFMEMVRDNVYILNVHNFFLHSPEPSLLPKSMLSLLKAVDRIAPCDLSVADDKLPVACLDVERKVNVIFYRYDLISVNLHAEVFYRKVYEGLTAEGGAEEPPAHSPVAPKAVPVANAAASDAAAAFVQDCDNFSKHYRSDFCTESNSAECGARADDEAAAKAEEVASKTCSRADRKVLPADAVMEAEAPPAGAESHAGFEKADPRALKMVGEFKTLIRKFKADFENFYALCLDAEERMETEQNVVGDENGVADDERASSSSEAHKTSGEKDASSEGMAEFVEAQHHEDEQPTKPISGDWFFNMNEARAKLRQYYESTVSGDWILKLGEAREKFRKRFGEYKRKFMKDDQSSSSSKERKNKTKGEKRRFKPVTEQFKDNLKKFSTKWKSQFKRVKDGIVHNYNKYVPTSWQFDTKNRWFYS